MEIEKWGTRDDKTNLVGQKAMVVPSYHWVTWWPVVGWRWKCGLRCLAWSYCCLCPYHCLGCVPVHCKRHRPINFVQWGGVAINWGRTHSCYHSVGGFANRRGALMSVWASILESFCRRGIIFYYFHPSRHHQCLVLLIF